MSETNRTQVSKDSMIVYPGKGRTLLLSILSLAFVAVLVWAAFSRDEIAENAQGITAVIAPILPFIWVVGIPFFVLCTVYLLYRLVKPRPSLRIDQEGIYENATLASVGLIRWDEIERVGMYSLVGQKMIGIMPTNFEPFLQRQSGLKRALLNMNKNKEFPISIPQNASDVPLEAVLEFVEQFIDEEKIG
ncbi:STM3941 family protein [Siminovitchia terrae]|uniref:STM3941 family protein n=1 Tax=Siminovitchia terrae TaxID=1914933 RepID=UPI0028ADC9EA|nr:STM3941 family protein [Siminovitchia terrae]